MHPNPDTFYNLIANAPLGIYVVDSEFRLRVISAGCRKIFSNVRPLLGRDFAEVLRIIWAEPFASQAIALFHRTLETGESYHSPDTTEQRRDTMDVESYDWQIQRITLPDSQPGVVCYFFDMTQRVRSQRLLTEQRRLLEMVASNRSLSDCLHNLTESVTRLHPAARAGVLIAAADRMRATAVYAAGFPPAFAESVLGASPLSGACGTAIREARPSTCTDVERAGEWTQQWRELCLKYGIHAAHSIPVFDPDGNPVASFFLTLGEAREPNEWELRIAEFGANIASIALDRDRYMNALHEHRQRLSGMLGSITDALAFLDSEWRITFLNEAALARTNYSREELLGRSILELFPDRADNQEAFRQLERAMTHRVSTRYEAHYNGRWTLGSVYPTSDGGLAIYSQDITQRKQLEEKAQQLARRLQLVTDAMPALISYVDADRRYRFNNKAYQDWFGFKPEAIPGKRMEEVLGESAYERLRPHVEAALAGRRVHFEEEVPYKGGGARSILGEYMPDFRLDGSVAGFYVLIQDISERHRAEKALRESREQYRALFESIDEGFCIIEMLFDEHGKPADYRFLQINPAFERETGLRGALGRTVLEMVPKHDANWLEIYGRVALTGEPVRFEDYSQSLRRWFSVFAFPFAGSTSRQIGLLFSNVTERKRAEEAIRHHTEEIEALLNAAPLGVYLVDADFKIREMNPIAREVFGDIPGGVTGRDFEEVMRLLWERQYADQVARIFRHTLETGEPYFTPERAEYRIDRNIIEYYEWHLNRITLPDGRYGVVCYFRDISQRVQARKEIERSHDALRETDRRKDEFLAMLAHELRNPLTPIRNAAQILKFPGVDAESRRAASDMLDRQVGQMVRLVDDLLDVSRITRGKIGLRKQRVELATIVNHAVETVRSLCESKHHKLTVELPPEPVYLDADPARLTQIVGNLLHNACKFTRRGGHIGLTARGERGQAVIRLRDDGIGIAPDQLPRIFEMFTQADTSLERTQSGLGIGLTLVKNLVEMHEGTVEARSPGIGKGSEFIVRLPAIAEPAAPEPSEPSPLPKGISRRILIVDDNRDLTDSLAKLLEMSGHEVHVASDGVEGVAAAEKLRPEVILLDIGLPKLNGYEAARKIRERLDGRAVLVAVTGWGQEADRLRSREAGFDAHLVKPLDLDALARLLADLDVRPPNTGTGFQGAGAFRS